MSCHTLLACRVSAERSVVNLMGIPLYVICCFSLSAFNIFSLYLIFDSLINMCLGVFHLGVDCGDIITAPKAAGRNFPFSSLFTQLLVFRFGFGPASEYWPPEGICSSLQQEEVKVAAD